MEFDPVNALSVAVDDLSVMECQRVLDFISGMKEGSRMASDNAIPPSTDSDRESFLADFAERSGIAFDALTQAGGTRFYEFRADNIIAISSEDAGFKSLLCTADTVYVSIDGGQAILSLVFKPDR